MTGFMRLKQPSGGAFDRVNMLAERHEPVAGEVWQGAELPPIAIGFGLCLGVAAAPFLSGVQHHGQKRFKPFNDTRRIDVQGEVENLIARLIGDGLVVT